MDKLFADDEVWNSTGEILKFMKNNRHLTVRECITLFMKQMKDDQWRYFEQMEIVLNRETQLLIQQSENHKLNLKY